MPSYLYVEQVNIEQFEGKCRVWKINYDVETGIKISK